ncbi:MAG: hypothetical protein QOD66_850 [Solirubrobacteraceae bacterium]|nr:hypothetical protein [Solirubrobacteraceae bacterium]
MSEINLNWNSAKVKDAKLTVELDGEASSEWKHSFDDTVRLLGGGDWGSVRVKKQTVRVDDVIPGGEDTLRFFLESVVEQANATQRPPDEPEQASDDSAASGVDGEMTERFRSFSGEDEDEEQSA